MLGKQSHTNVRASIKNGYMKRKRMENDVSKIDLREIDSHVAKIEWTHSNPKNVRVSVIIVAYNTNRALIQCLSSLQHQTVTDFEIILVDNGKNELVIEEMYKFNLLYIRLNRNYRPSLARNIGTLHAKGEIICFLDDDGTADQDFVKQHILANQTPGVLGVRGKIRPRTDSPYNALAWHYDLGDKVMPAYIDLEGNASFPRQILQEVDGFDPNVFGGEGAEISYRIVKRFGDRDGLIYWPGAVIYHDYASGFMKYIRKSLRGAKMGVILDRQNPELRGFIQSYDLFKPAEITPPKNIFIHAKLALIFRTQNIMHTWAPRWYRWSTAKK